MRHRFIGRVLDAFVLWNQPTYLLCCTRKNEHSCFVILGSSTGQEFLKVGGKLL